MNKIYNMEIVKYKKKNASEYKVMLSDNTSLSFYDDTIIYFNLLAKKNIDDKYLKEVIEYNKNYEAYYKALKDVSVKLRTEKELISRLKKKEYSLKNIEFAIEKLKAQGYLNDDLYLKSYIADQINLSVKGPRKILYDLKKLGFKDEGILSYLDEYDSLVWKEKVEKIIDKKIKANHNLSDIMLKNKIKKDLINLGYDTSIIESCLSSFDFNNDSDVIKKEYNKAYVKFSKKYTDEDLRNKIKYHLYQKGFSMSSIEDILNKEM